MMTTMTATAPSVADQELATFATAAQQSRFSAAMKRLADAKEPGAPVRVYISAAPRTRESEKWGSWVARIREGLPEGVELLQFEELFADKPYDWDRAVETLDGLVVVGRQKRKGSRVYFLSAGVRRELRSLIAQKPTFMFVHGHGLIPAIDCGPKVLPEHRHERLKLTAPKRWEEDSKTLSAALDALRPAGTQETSSPTHLEAPFTVR